MKVFIVGGSLENNNPEAVFATRKSAQTHIDKCRKRKEYDSQYLEITPMTLRGVTQTIAAKLLAEATAKEWKR